MTSLHHVLYEGSVPGAPPMAFNIGGQGQKQIWFPTTFFTRSSLGHGFATSKKRHTVCPFGQNKRGKLSSNPKVPLNRKEGCKDFFPFLVSTRPQQTRRQPTWINVLFRSSSLWKNKVIKLFFDCVGKQRLLTDINVHWLEINLNNQNWALKQNNNYI